MAITYFGEQGLEKVTQFSVEEFRMKVNQLLALTLDAGNQIAMRERLI